MPLPNDSPLAVQFSVNPDYLEKLKSLKQVKTNFNQWKAYLEDNPHLDLAEAIKSMDDLDIRIPRLVRPFIEADLTLYRTRVIAEDSEDDICDPRSFSYPPSTANFQRASVPGYPVFYGAIDGKTAMEELRVNGQPLKKGDTIFLSKWKIKPGVQYSLANFTLPEITDDDQLISDLTKQLDHELKRIFQSEDDFFEKTQVFLFRESCKLFLEGSYLQSGTIAYDSLFKTGEVNGINIAGILYPSCCNQYRSMNFAFKPEFVDEYMELVEVKKVVFKEFTLDGAFATESYFGRITNGRIQWKSYQTKLMHKEFKVQLDTEDEWPADLINNSSLLIHDKLTDLYTYCKDRVDAIDLSGYKIPDDQKQLYHDGEAMMFINDITFSPDIAYLRNGDQINGLKLLRIFIPSAFSTPNIDPQKVLKNKIKA